jgi:acyl carrier protein
MNDITICIIKLLKEHTDALELVNITPETHLISSGFMESFEVIEIVFALEQEFDITVPLAELDLEDFDSAGSIAGVVQRLLEKGR